MELNINKWVNVYDDFKIKIGIRTISQMKECENLLTDAMESTEYPKELEGKKFDEMTEEEKQKLNDTIKINPQIFKEYKRKIVLYTLEDWEGLTSNNQPIQCIYNKEEKRLSDESFEILLQNQSLVDLIFEVITENIETYKKK
jgi:hypothetical protein